MGVGAVASGRLRTAHAQSEEDGGKPGDTPVAPVMLTVSNYIAYAAQKPLPDAVAETTKHHLLDTLAAIISGSHLPPGRKAIAYVKAQGGAHEASVPGSSLMTTVVNAALAG